jgi:hypothetical protein
MRRARVLQGLALAVGLVVPLTGCASGGGGSVRVDMVKMCEAHGGTWSPSQETCALSTSEANRTAKQARDICAYQAGTYLPGGSCILPGR